jgi:hypothetical protein
MIARCYLTVSLVLAACTDYRQLVLSIDTTAGVPCDIDRVQIRATSAVATTTFERSLRGARLPLEIALLDDTRDGQLTLDVVGLQGGLELMYATGMVQFAGAEVTVPVLLDPGCTKDISCGLSGPESGPGAARLQCGSNVTRYKISPTTEGFQDVCGLPGAERVLVDGGRGPVRPAALESALPSFGFQFYGRPLQQVWIHREGFVSFAHDNPDPLGDLDPAPLDDDITGKGLPPPPQSVMAFWDALTLGPRSQVCYLLEGTPGTQVLRVTWSGVCLAESCVTDDLNITLTLEEASQSIVLTYGTMIAGTVERAQGSNATVGLVNRAIGCAASACSSESGLCSDGVTPCGYSQVFSQVRQQGGVQNRLFTPILDRD